MIAGGRIFRDIGDEKNGAARLCALRGCRRRGALRDLGGELRHFRIGAYDFVEHQLDLFVPAERILVETTADDRQDCVVDVRIGSLRIRRLRLDDLSSDLGSVGARVRETSRGSLVEHQPEREDVCLR